MPPDEPNDEEELEKLAEDNETPFRPAANSQGDPATAEPTDRAAQSDIDDTHPATDTNLQPEEEYDEGISGAAEASEPNAGNSVTGYNPPESDQEEGEETKSP